MSMESPLPLKKTLENTSARHIVEAADEEMMLKVVGSTSAPRSD
jgi:hypothetical protein